MPKLYGHPAGDVTIVALAAVAVLLFGVVIIRAVSIDRGPRSVDMLHGRTLAATPPLGWSNRAVWSSPPLLRGTGRILIRAGAVGMITATRRVVLVDALTGRALWSRDLPNETIRTALTATRIEGQDVVAVQTDRRLLWWQLSDGRPREVELPTGAVGSFLGEAPLIGVDRGTVATVSGDGRLQRHWVPPGAVAFAARADGRVTVASPAGWWHLAPGESTGAAQPFPPPDPQVKASPTVVSYHGGHLITLWPAAPGAKPQVAVYSDRDRVRYSFSGPVTPPEARTASSGTSQSGKPSSAHRWHPSPSGTWGILDRTQVNIRAGRVRDLGAWTTRHVAEDRALGAVGGAAAVVGPDLEQGLLTDGESFPEAVLPSAVLVRAAEGADEVIHVLPWGGSQSAVPSPGKTW